MKASKTESIEIRKIAAKGVERTHPPLWSRIFSVWYRHIRVYTKNLISNVFPTFLEPLIFLAGIGLGLGRYIVQMNSIPYIQFLASGLLVTAAMFTSAFECTFGTFIRLEFDKVYDGMLAAPITANNLLVGEIIWAGSKGFFFTFSVLIVITVFDILPVQNSYSTPLVGFFTGAMFASLSLFITSFVTNINHFNFYFSGFISPMFFFAGVVFPVENLPKWMRPAAEILPLTHPVRITRGISLGNLEWTHLFDFLYIIIFTCIFGFLAIIRLKKRLIN
ncbi:MAG: ABC transporter permease [Spirochaetota bacterium]